jgi:predicted dehydrogenase
MPTVVEEIEEFTRCIRTEEKPEIGGDVALRNLAVVLAAVDSAESGRPVEVASLLSQQDRGAINLFDARDVV